MTVSTRECQSMRLLARDDWSTGELRMTMHVSRGETVRHHVLGQCSHQHGVSPLQTWDGASAPESLSAEDRGVTGEA